MLKRPVTTDDLARLREERDQADRCYNDALTALDRALPRLEPAATAVAAYDDSQVAPLNERWKILEHTALPPVRGFRSRLAHFVWGLVSPVFERQQAFNATLVDHVNRNVGAARAQQQVADATAQLLAAHAAALATFQSHLIIYLQQVTAYVDTKDRLVTGSLMSVYDAALNGLTDELLKRWESLSAREARFDGKVAATSAAYDDLRGSLATVQQSTLTIKRELERVLAGAMPTAANVAAPKLDSYKYVGFEDRFRGSQADISARLESYVPLFAGARDVLDVGCGRGELLDLLRKAGVEARGLELNHEMAETCRARGLEVAEGDLLSYLEALPDGALGGLIAIQVVEHLEPDYLMRALDVAYHKLRPGAPIVLETINPACWFAFFASYVRDLTHVRPLHPETLTYLLTASGFMRVRAEYRSPYPDSDKLQKIAPATDAFQADLADTVNSNIERLNALLFTYMDYAAIGERGVKGWCLPAALAVLAWVAAPAERPVPFRAGETLTFDVSWSQFVTAGTATMAVREKRPSFDSIAYYIVADGQPTALLSRLYTLYYKADTLLDVSTLLPQRASVYSKEGARERLKALRFDQTARRGVYEIKTSKVVTRTLTLPAMAQDPLSAIYVLRSSPLKLGATIAMPVVNNGEIYRMDAKVVAKETVATSVGQVPSWKIVPTIFDEHGKPTGDKLGLWISDDGRRLPVKLEANLPIGDFRITLKEVRN